MEIKSALTRQYRASLQMLRQCIEVCPDHMWNKSNNRPYWNIAGHALYFTHLYMVQTEEDFVSFEPDIEVTHNVWDPISVDVFFSKEQLLGYCDQLFEACPGLVEKLNLEAEETGYYWYKDMGKYEHQLVNLKHLQGHVGQLSELLMAEGIDIDWVSKA
ncbi:MAG: hypothetical protein KDC26_08400 [Armatimonadetes bacterium]|nr:hypothetical protein [Armatimonadota bacterium]